jgi:hypothetical protein
MGTMRQILEKYKGTTPAIRFRCERNGSIYFAKFFPDRWEDHIILGTLTKEKKPFNEYATEDPKQYQVQGAKSANIAQKVLDGPTMHLNDPYNTSAALPPREQLEISLPGRFKRLSYNPTFMPSDPAFRTARDMANNWITKYFK